MCPGCPDAFFNRCPIMLSKFNQWYLSGSELWWCSVWWWCFSQASSSMNLGSCLAKKGNVTKPQQPSGGQLSSHHPPGPGQHFDDNWFTNVDAATVTLCPGRFRDFGGIPPPHTHTHTHTHTHAHTSVSFVVSSYKWSGHAHAWFWGHPSTRTHSLRCGLNWSGHAHACLYRPKGWGSVMPHFWHTNLGIWTYSVERCCIYNYIGIYK